MPEIIGPDKVLTGACGKYRAPSGSLILPDALDRMLAEALAASGDDECDGTERDR